MKRRKRILDALYTTAPAEGAGAAGGTTDNGGASGGGSAQTTTPPPPADKPAGYVPVGELAQERQKRHELEAKVNAMTEGQNKQLEAFKIALGLKPDQTPEQLQAAMATEQEKAKFATTQLAVFQAATGIANPTLLLDSDSFKAKLKTIDPANADAVKAAITEFVTNNPHTAAAPVAPAGSDDAGTKIDVQGKSDQTINDLIRSAVVGK